MMIIIKSLNFKLVIIYLTQRYYTMRQHPFFQNLVEEEFLIEKIPIVKNNENKEIPIIYLDRDGTHFRIILNYLRTSKLIVPSHIYIDYQEELKVEAEYYRLQEVVEIINHFQKKTAKADTKRNNILIYQP